jgi:hypothetical protein
MAPKSKKPVEDKKGKAYMKKVGETVRKGQNGKTPIDKINGLIPAEGTGIDPITNTSYPRRRR